MDDNKIQWEWHIAEIASLKITYTVYHKYLSLQV